MYAPGPSSSSLHLLLVLSSGLCQVASIVSIAMEIHGANTNTDTRAPAPGEWEMRQWGSGGHLSKQVIHENLRPHTILLDTMIPVFPDDNDSLSVRCLMSNAGHGETWDIPPELEWLHCPGRSELVTPDSGMGRLRLLSSELLIRDIDWATSGPDKWASAPSRQIYLQRRARRWLRRDKQHIIRAQCLQTCSNTHRQLPKH